MTQTQTTEDRIKLMIDAAYTTDNAGVILESNFWRVARDVAAEIDAKGKRILELEADVHDAGQRNDDMAASLPTWIDVTVLLPASGTKVLAWDGKNILRAMYAKRFTEEVRPGGEEEATEYSEGLDGYFLVAGWYEHNEFDEVHWTIENPLTHWMPLPAPPEVKS